MPRLKDLETYKGGSFNFSAVKPDDLESSRYTLVAIVNDSSGSVGHFKNELEKMLKTILETCQKSPDADNLMIRLIEFDNKLTELHGFQLLSTLNPADYDNVLNIGGATALYDAAMSGIESVFTYGKTLIDQEYEANAIVFVLTDGDDNSSAKTAKDVADAVKRGRRQECLDSINTILIGVNDGNSYVKQYLDTFSKEGEFDQYIPIDQADASSLAKLAQFISSSISSTSQALGSGSPSQALKFP